MDKRKELEARVVELEKQLTNMEMVQRVAQELNTARDEDELLQAIVQPVIETDVARVSLNYVDVDEAGEPAWLEEVAVWQRDGQGTPGARFYLPEFPVSRLWFADANKPLLIGDVATDDRVDDNSRKLMQQLGVQASVSIPLTQAERWVGIIMFGWHKARDFSEREIALYTALPRLAAPAVENQRLVKNLEAQITARTKELATSESQYRTAINAIDDVLHVIDANLCLVLYNATFSGWLQSMNISDEVIGQNLFELFPFLPEKNREEYLRVLETGEKIVTEDCTEVVGQVRYAETRKIPVFDGDKPVRVVTVIHDITERKEAEKERIRLQQQVVEAQQQVIQELSTPIIPIMDRIIVMPLVGIIDTKRARDTTRTLLAGISEHRAKVVILDITGVPVVDSGVAAHLDKSIQAARLKGARTIITGISDAVAEAIVDLGIDWSEIETLRDLQTGLIVALRGMGVELSKK